MQTWALSIVVLAVLFVVLSFGSRQIEKRKGRSKSVTGAWPLLAPLGIFFSILFSTSLLDLDLPWMMVVAGFSTGILGLCTQFFAGNRGAK